MADEEPLAPRLQTLRQRWEGDRSSSVFLQLADEFRRIGRLADAAEILEAGLSSHPRHPAAQVALARCWLELDRAGRAAPLLRTVVEADPTHLVASKLLAEASLALGDAETARRQLDHYALLNPRDPELPVLWGRLGGLKGAGDAARVRPAFGGGVVAGGNGEVFSGLVRAGDEERLLRSFALGAVFDVIVVPRRPEGEREPQPAPATAAFVVEPPEVPHRPFEEVPPETSAGPLQAAPSPEPLVEGPAGGAEPAGEEPATVTLGQLYLEQGHPREARRIFERVLEGQPAHAEAAAALERARARGEAPLTARELLAGRQEEDRLETRITLLSAYLRRLRGARRDAEAP